MHCAGFGLACPDPPGWQLQLSLSSGEPFCAGKRGVMYPGVSYNNVIKVGLYFERQLYQKWMWGGGVWCIITCCSVYIWIGIGTGMNTCIVLCFTYFHQVKRGGGIHFSHSKCDFISLYIYENAYYVPTRIVKKETMHSPVQQYRICTKYLVGWRTMLWRQINRWRRCPCSVWCQCIAGVSAEWCRPGSWRVLPSQVIPCGIKNLIILIYFKVWVQKRIQFSIFLKIILFRTFRKRIRIFLCSQLSSKGKVCISSVSQHDGMGKGCPPAPVDGMQISHVHTAILIFSQEYCYSKNIKFPGKDRLCHNSESESLAKSLMDKYTKWVVKCS